MAFVCELLREKDPSCLTYSYEYFPPRTDVGVQNLERRIGSMLADKPLFMDVTWGAGGSTSDSTISICKTIRELGGNPSMHLTCTNMHKSMIDEALESCKEHGIVNILALRGDPPHGEDKWTASDEDFTCALDLIKYIRRQLGDDVSIVCAGYPEGHPCVITEETGPCPDEHYASEIAYLKEKVDAGAKAIVTQLFFDTGIFLKWVDACREAGIHVPLIPGIMPITTYGGFKRMTGLCKTYVPPDLAAKLEAAQEDSAKIIEIGHEHVLNMCKELVAAGHNHLHFYTLNTEGPTWRLLTDLGVQVGTVPVPKAPAAAAPAAAAAAPAEAVAVPATEDVSKAPAEATTTATA